MSILRSLVKSLIYKIQYLFHPETAFWFLKISCLLEGGWWGARVGLRRGRKSHDFNYNFQHIIPALDFLGITRKSYFCRISMLFSWLCFLLLSGVFPLTRNKRNDGSRDLVHFSPNLISLVLTQAQSVTSPISKSNKITPTSGWENRCSERLG